LAAPPPPPAPSRTVPALLSPLSLHASSALPFPPWCLRPFMCAQDVLADAMSHVEARLPEYGAAELPPLLWALARLRARPDRQFMAACLAQCFSQARSLSPGGLAMVVWCLASLPFSPPQGWVAKALLATHARMSSFSAADLSGLVTSMARLEVRPSEAWLHAFSAAALGHVRAFGPSELAHTLWALATLHYNPGADWLAAFGVQLREALPSLKPGEVVMVAWAVRLLGWQPGTDVAEQLARRSDEGGAAASARMLLRMFERAERVKEGLEDMKTRVDPHFAESRRHGSSSDHHPDAGDHGECGRSTPHARVRRMGCTRVSLQAI
jgi:hypothetical protein